MFSQRLLVNEWPEVNLHPIKILWGHIIFKNRPNWNLFRVGNYVWGWFSLFKPEETISYGFTIGIFCLAMKIRIWPFWKYFESLNRLIHKIFLHIISIIGYVLKTFRPQNYSICLCHFFPPEFSPPAKEAFLEPLCYWYFVQYSTYSSAFYFSFQLNITYITYIICRKFIKIFIFT